MKQIPFLLLFAMITFIACSDSTDEPLIMGPDTPDEPAVELEVAPQFQLNTYDGAQVSLSDYQDKTLVIFFFGNSCPPCQAVAPKIESDLKEAFKDKSNFAIIGIDQWDGNAASVEGFKERTGVTFPLALNGSGVASSYGTTYDRLVVINEEGKIEYKGTSIAANNLDDVITLVRELVN